MLKSTVIFVLLLGERSCQATTICDSRSEMSPQPSGIFLILVEHRKKMSKRIEKPHKGSVGLHNTFLQGSFFLF